LASLWRKKRPELGKSAARKPVVMNSSADERSEKIDDKPYVVREGGKRVAVRGGRQNVNVQMPKGKIQIADHGFRTTSTKLTDTDTKLGARGRGCSLRKTIFQCKIDKS
jgi:hypothetical protein